MQPVTPGVPFSCRQLQGEQLDREEHYRASRIAEGMGHVVSAEEVVCAEHYSLAGSCPK